jgi:hypothetical protein
MSLDPTGPIGRLLSWYGLLGAPLAWTFFHVAGVGIATGACSPFGVANDADTQPFTLILMVVCAAVALGGLLAAGMVWLATRDVDDTTPPPIGRIHFLAVIGLVITPLFVAMILMGGLGGAVLGCGQG